MPRLQKHFKKMFAGIHQILLDDEQTQVLGIASKEGEEACAYNNNNNNNTRVVERRGAIASEALADRSSQLARNRREEMSFKSSFK